MAKWEAPIPKKPKNKDVKRCYTVWWKMLRGYSSAAGGKVVWLTDREKTFAYIKHSNIILKEVLEKDSLEEYKKYINQTID